MSTRIREFRSKLTAQQLRFVDEYLIDLNGTRVAIRAGYSHKGAEVRGSELVTIPRQSRGLSFCEPLKAAKRGR